MLMSGALLERSTSNQIRKDRAKANIPDNILSFRQYGRSSCTGENSFAQTNNNRTTGRSGIGIEGSCHDRHNVVFRDVALDDSRQNSGIHD